jgi:2-keto-4-pentenoate hydratase/2-oxohepta-3-ene-1,7-dioic acid hydratase in catechol pathway
MRLATIQTPHGPRAAVATADAYIDLHATDAALPASVRDLLAAGPGALKAAAATAGRSAAVRVGVRGAKLLPPVPNPAKIICVGLNYRDHAEETGAEIPAEPIIFMKASNTVVGPDDDVLIPPGSEQTDYEVELAVVMGGRARYLDSPADARALIAGYAISNDVSEREYQLERGGTWDKGKSCETFNPLGPHLVTADEIADPQDLGLRLWVNGDLRQDGNTKNMIFPVDHLIWYLSRFMVLDPGDVINTGTPAGVALGSPGIPFLRQGDIVELEIDGLGRQRQRLA